MKQQSQYYLASSRNPRNSLGRFLSTQRSSSCRSEDKPRPRLAQVWPSTHDDALKIYVWEHPTIYKFTGEKFPRKHKDMLISIS